MARAQCQPAAYWTPGKVARHMGLSIAQFRALLPAYLQRGFPLPDEVSGNFHVESVQAWIRARNPQPDQLTVVPPGGHALSIDELLERAEAGWVP
jgi:hypothetical protein